MEFRATSSPTSRRLAIVHGAAELLRDHPIFAVPVPGEEVPILAPEDREEAWARETLQLLHRRVKFVWLAMLLALPAHWLFYISLEGAPRLQITLVEGLMAGACSFVYLLAKRNQSSSLIRLCSFISYILFAITASADMTLAHNDPRALALSGHPQLILALLFVPFTVTEAGLCVLLISLAFSIGLSCALPADQIIVRLISVCLSGTLVLIMTHLQGLARRRAFDAAFDMAVSASQGASLSNSDFLTGAPNRRHFEAMAGAELKRSIRHKRPLAIVLFDLDGFKNVNDSHGHASGDRVLCEVFAAAQDTVRTSDVLARWGGDEFVLALIETDDRHATRTAQRLGEAVENRLRTVWGEGSRQACVTLSVGIACTQDGENITLAQLVDRADAALYESKRAGKNRITLG